MSLIVKGRMEIKLGEYSVGSATALVDPLLVTKAQDYRRHVASRLIPLEPDTLLQRLPTADYHVSLKIDGEFDLLIYADGEVITVNPGGTVRAGLPFMKEAVAQFKKAGVRKAIIAGELYYVKAAGKRPRVHDVSRVARQPASQTELDDLAFGAFDILDIDGVGPSPTVEQTWKRLGSIFAKGKRSLLIESIWAKEPAAVELQFRKWVEQGAEGAVLRSDTAGTFKVKPFYTIDAVVIGFTEGTDDRKGMIHDLLLALVRADGCFHVLGHVGGGFDTNDRRGFLSDLKDMIVESDYVEVNDQVAYHMVRPDWIIEISVLDLISQSTRGQPLHRMALNYDRAKKRYEIVRRLPLVGLISPQFIRRREDKALNPSDVGMRQVTDIVEVLYADRDARKLNLASSTILRREVQTKVLKGATMVRKLVMWQTNKESEGGDYPAFVIHSTDFSPNRKTPLERDIRVSSSREQIDELWKELAAEAFTKGWAPVGAAGTATAVASEPEEKAPAKKRATKKNAE